MLRHCAGLGLPLPLGGSSNHFRTGVLREVCGWDAWNVTEDADLGLRLARFGFGVGILPSSTQEEAPRSSMLGCASGGALIARVIIYLRYMRERDGLGIAQQSDYTAV